jgi:hypothetical protein
MAKWVFSDQAGDFLNLQNKIKLLTNHLLLNYHLKHVTLFYSMKYFYCRRVAIVFLG